MKVATWNIAGGHPLLGSGAEALRENYAQETLGYFTETLRKVNVDCVALQETHIAFHGDGSSQADVIGSELRLHVSPSQPYGKSHIKDGRLLALANLSRLPILQTYFHKLPNPGLTVVRPDGARWVSQDVGFLVSQVLFQEELIQFVNGHMVPFHYFGRSFHELAFQRIRDDISHLFMALAQTGTIIAADFNYTNLQDLLPRIFEDGSYQDAFIADTTPDKGQQDHILLSKQWQYRSCEIKKTETDHYLCLADVTLK